jgi:general secretion pathway protein H
MVRTSSPAVTATTPIFTTDGPRCGGARGFTLIEVLVVVVLIAITAALVAVKLAPDDQHTLRNEATKLALLLEQARDEAIGTGSSVAWQPEQGGYRFAHRTPDRTWQPYAEDPFRQQTLQTPVQMTGVEINGHLAGYQDLLVFSPVGGNPTFRIHLTVADARLRIRSDTPAEIVVEPE